MTIWKWIFGVGFLALVLIIFIIALKYKKLKQYRRIMLIALVFVLLGIAIPVLLTNVVSKDMLRIVLLIDIPVTLILFYMGAVLSLKNLNLYLWNMPYDNEKEKKKLIEQQNNIEKVVYGFPFYAVILIGLIVWIKFFE